METTATSATSTPTFDQLPLPETLRKSLAKMNFQTPTPIQAKAVPLALEGKDVIGCAQTGTGKTGAFVIPTVARLSKNPQETALIMTPTRELALQIFEVVRNMTWFEKKFGAALLIGGASYGPQFQQLRQKPRLVIGTPGRIQDHLDQKSLKLDQVGVLVLDEADRMLDMGFAPQIESILKGVPTERQTFLFTATLPREIERMAQRFMKSPERVMVGENSKPVAKIKQEMIETRENEKLGVLFEQINARVGSVLIFAGTKRRTDRLSEELEMGGYDVVSIHGDRSQRQRADAIRIFKRGQARILVATDVAARGLDVPHIAHVINFDLPQVPEDFIHRIGRTARAGAEGNALSLVTPSDRGMWKRIQRLIGGETEPSGQPRNRGYGPRRADDGRGFSPRRGPRRPAAAANSRGPRQEEERSYSERGPKRGFKSGFKKNSRPSGKFSGLARQSSSER
jgi:superfamily II DNA/RNA helicase